MITYVFDSMPNVNLDEYEWDGRVLTPPVHPYKHRFIVVTPSGCVSAASKFLKEFATGASELATIVLARAYVRANPWAVGGEDALFYFQGMSELAVTVEVADYQLSLTIAEFWALKELNTRSIVVNPATLWLLIEENLLP